MGCVGALYGRCRPAGPPRRERGWTASDAATVEGGPVSGLQLRDAGSHRGPQCGCRAGDPVAAIQVTTIRDGRITTGGACREWTKIKSAGDRRGSGRVRTGGAQFRRPTRWQRPTPFSRVERLCGLSELCVDRCLSYSTFSPRSSIRRRSSAAVCGCASTASSKTAPSAILHGV